MNTAEFELYRLSEQDRLLKLFASTRKEKLAELRSAKNRKNPAVTAGNSLFVDWCTCFSWGMTLVYVMVYLVDHSGWLPMFGPMWVATGCFAVAMAISFAAATVVCLLVNALATWIESR